MRSRRELFILSILHGMCFGITTLLGMSLTYWQIQRAQRIELRHQGNFLAKDVLHIKEEWTYEKPNRMVGLYYIVECERTKKCYGISHEDFNNTTEFRAIPWQSAKWCDTKNLYDRDTGERYDVLTDLLSKKADGQMLKMPWNEAERLKKKHRHYAYALQWAGLTLASMVYWLKGLRWHL